MLKILRAGCLVLLTIALVAQSGCDPNEFGVNSGPVGTNDRSHPNHGNGAVNGNGTSVDPNQPPQLVIGSFNIQMFGKTKMSKPGVVAILTDVARRFDILAIQELRDKDQNVIPEFLKLINADGSTYAASVGPRQGYVIKGEPSNYFEQTVFIFDTKKVELLSPTYAAHDRYRIMHRPPFVGHFRSLEVPPEQAFSFALMNVHIDPDDAHVEFEALQEIIGEIYANHRGEDDFILLGDMNEEPRKYQRYQWMRNQFAAIPNNLPTNTLGTRAYDNIIFDASYTSEFRNQAGVMDLKQVYGLSLQEAQLVSDHLPVWAVFSAYEAPRAEMTQGVPVDVIR